MILGLLFLILLVSPTSIVVGVAIARIGFGWSLLLIPTGSMLGAILLAVCGGYCYEFMIWQEDRRTGAPPAGAIGAATGRAIFQLIIMAVGGWIGAGGGAWLVAKFWLRVI